MKTPKKIVLAMVVGFALTIIISLMVAGVGFLFPILVATILLPIVASCIAVEEIIYGSKKAKLIGATILFIITGGFVLLTAQPVNHYCRGVKISVWTSDMPVVCKF